MGGQWKKHFPQAPSILLFDLDKTHLLPQVLKTIDDIIGGHPTVINSGNGLHILQPIKCPVLEDVFTDFVEPSNSFLKWTPRYLSDGSTDPNHNPSVGSCWLRIPGSFNEMAEVKIVQRWDGNAVSILPLMTPFFNYLMDERMKLLSKPITPNHIFMKTKCRIYGWIERLLKTGVDDGRVIAIWLILSRYLININDLSFDESYQIIMEWLDKCKDLRPLGFNAKSMTKSYLRNAQKTGHKPLSKSNVKNRSESLSHIVMSW